MHGPYLDLLIDVIHQSCVFSIRCQRKAAIPQKGALHCQATHFTDMLSIALNQGQSLTVVYIIRPILRP